MTIIAVINMQRNVDQTEHSLHRKNLINATGECE